MSLSALSGCRFLFYLPFKTATTGTARKLLQIQNTPNIKPALARIPAAVHLSISSKFNNVKLLATREEVQAAEKDKNVLMIDVREPSELKETGIIPGSINIPLGDVEHVLSNVSPEDFKKTYNREKPKADFPIIFFCKIGKRSEAAQDIAIKLKYKNVKNYRGSWLDWEKNVLKKG